MVNDERADGVRIEIGGSEATPRIELHGELDLATADAVRTELADVTGGADRVELDLLGLEFLDSSGLAVLIELAGRVDLAVVAISDPARRVVVATGLEDVLGMAP